MRGLAAPFVAAVGRILAAMNSTFKTSLKSTPGLQRGAVAALPARQALGPSAAHGYRLSSDELNAGLDMRTVSITTLPVELVSELIRMRGTWGDSVANIDVRILN